MKERSVSPMGRCGCFEETGGAGERLDDRALPKGALLFAFSPSEMYIMADVGPSLSEKQSKQETPDMFVCRDFSGRMRIVSFFCALSFAFWAEAGEASKKQVTAQKGWMRANCHTGAISGSVSRSGTVPERKGSGNSKRKLRLPDDQMLEKLSEIHKFQLSLLEDADKLSRAERHEKIKKIRQNYSQISPVISATRKFPFPSQMDDVEDILKKIRSGRIRSEFSGEEKADAELLKEIQRVQVERFKDALARGNRKKRK